MTEKFTGWIASMSDGETVFQEPDVAGEPTAWRKLLNRCAENEDLYITQLQLQSGGHTHVAIPNADGYLAVYEAKASLTKPGRPQKVYQGIGAVFGDFVFLTFTNHQGTWRSDVRELSSMLVHCQLKPAGARSRLDERPLLASRGRPLAVIDVGGAGESADYNTS